MSGRAHCPRCEDFGRVETESGLLACPEPRHRAGGCPYPCDGPSAGELLEERYRAREEEAARREREYDP